MRALVTGATGFVGRYLTAALRDAGADVHAFGGPEYAGNDASPLDVLDAGALAAAFERARPTHAFHLAAQTFVPASFDAPEETYRTNAMGTALLARAAREYTTSSGKTVRVLFTSSAEVYGERESAEFPLRETLDLRPANPYAASKAAAEAMLLAETRSLRLDAVVARAFNHIGPGQSPRFAVAGFAAQLAAIARGAPPLLPVGNLDAARDVLDVRDVVAAYVALARDGERGEAYNVCSGSAVTIRSMLGELIRIARVPVEVRDDPARIRPLDVPLFVGSNEKLTARTGWHPSIGLQRSLRDVYDAALASAGNSAPRS